MRKKLVAFLMVAFTIAIVTIVVAWAQQPSTSKNGFDDLESDDLEFVLALGDVLPRTMEVMAQGSAIIKQVSSGAIPPDAGSLLYKELRREFDNETLIKILNTKTSAKLNELHLLVVKSMVSQSLALEFAELGLKNGGLIESKELKCALALQEASGRYSIIAAQQVKKVFDTPIKTKDVASSQSIEKEIREFAEREYPNDSKMQQYIYEKQMSAYSYMLNVTDSEVKKIATSEYPNDYSMQKHIYDNQLSAKRYMKTVTDKEVKKIAIPEYPNDYSMQKHIYDKQLSAKQYMNSMPNSNAKSKAQREYPNDYSMQKYIYDKSQ